MEGSDPFAGLTQNTPWNDSTRMVRSPTILAGFEEVSGRGTQTLTLRIVHNDNYANHGVLQCDVWMPESLDGSAPRSKMPCQATYGSGSVNDFEMPSYDDFANLKRYFPSWCQEAERSFFNEESYKVKTFNARISNKARIYNFHNRSITVEKMSVNGMEVPDEFLVPSNHMEVHVEYSQKWWEKAGDDLDPGKCCTIL